MDLRTVINAPGLFYAAVALGLTYFAVRAFGGTLTRLGRRFSDKRLLLHQITTVGRFAIYLVGITVAVALSVNLSKEVVIALTGTAAVTIGLALKDIAASIIAGIIIIIDRPFQVGDRITFDGTYGEVSAIGLRSVRVVTLDDNVVTIPNNKFLTDVVASGNWGALDMLVQMDFHVAADQDIGLAKRLLEQALASTRYAFTEKPWVVLVNQIVLGEAIAVRLRAKAYVLDVKYEKAFETDVTERALMAFAAHGIRAPAVLYRGLDPSPARERSLIDAAD